ncbi:hypothetical protein Pan258_36150 [Symmachiella dynata]|uniref:hypothetical protein n=1 Tax=Symmachiella dynata TaxID=2527995 RepID=UPI00118C806E|nr:hypothetical protein [Symmachiella dynata]QDT49562.1 hypothetical protein Pan258_36150 [Symmachiella dynata]
MRDNKFPLFEASLTCRGCGYEVYFDHGGGGTAVYSCDKCREICTPQIVPFYFRNPACPGCGGRLGKEDRVLTGHMRPSIDTIPCPRCKSDRMDLMSHCDISFIQEGILPAVGQTIHASVTQESPIYPGAPYLFVPGLASGEIARLADISNPPASGYHRFRVVSIQQGDVKPGKLRRITVEHIGPIADDEMWNNDAPL